MRYWKFWTLLVIVSIAFPLLNEWLKIIGFSLLLGTVMGYHKEEITDFLEG